MKPWKGSFESGPKGSVWQFIAKLQSQTCVIIYLLWRKSPALLAWRAMYISVPKWVNQNSWIGDPRQKTFQSSGRTASRMTIAWIVHRRTISCIPETSPHQPVSQSKSSAPKIIKLYEMDTWRNTYGAPTVDWGNKPNGDGTKDPASSNK